MGCLPSPIKTVVGRLRITLRQRNRERAQVGFRAAAGKCAAELILVPANSLRDPAEGLLFNPRCELRPRQRSQLRIQRGDQGLRQHRHIGWRGIDQAKIIRAGNMKSLIDHLRANVVEDSRSFIANFGQSGLIKKKAALRGGRLHWAIFQRGKIFVDAVDQLIAKLSTLVGIQVKSHAGTCFTGFYPFGDSAGLSSAISLLFAWGRIKGNRITSRMEREPVNTMVRRSMPMPSPPVGGRPKLSARTKSSSMAWASVSPRSRSPSCCRNRLRCSTGSFNSLNALPSSNPPI